MTTKEKLLHLMKLAGIPAEQFDSTSFAQLAMRLDGRASLSLASYRVLS